MPNIKISDLPPITLPVVGDESFFEVQTVEAGQDVSRKISLDEIVSTTGLDASFLTVSANAQLPNERVLTEGANVTFVDTGPNGTLTISVSGAGFGDVFKVGTPVDNQIGVWTGDGTIEGDPNFTWDGSQLLLPLENVPGAPTIGFGDGDSGFFQPLDDNLQLSLVGTSRFFWELDSYNAATGTGPRMQNAAASATAPGFIPRRSDPNTGIGSAGNDILSLIAGGVSIAQATSVGNNQFALAQSGSSSVPELTSLADPDTGFGWTGVNTMRWIGGGTRAWNFSTARFFSQFSNGPSLENLTAQADVPTVLPDHSDGNTGLGATGSDVLTLVAGGVEGLRLTEGASHIVQRNENQTGLTASVTQTQAGGLGLLSSYNEITTVANEGDALTAFSVAAGDRLVVINNGVNDLQLFPAIGDNIGAGVDAAIIMGSGNVAVFLGRDSINWDTLFNGNPNSASTGGATLQGTWRFDSSTVEADPGSGDFRLDNATVGLTTEIFISSFTRLGFDADNILGLLSSGDQLYIQNRTDSAQFLLFDITANVDNGGWFSLAGTVNLSGSNFANNRDCGIVLLFGAGGGGADVVAGDTDGEILIWDVGNNQYEPVPDSVLRINPASPPTSPLGRIISSGSSTTDVRKATLVVNIGASVSAVWSTNKGGGTQEGFYSRSELNGSTVFHNWGFWDDANQTGIDNFTIFDNGQFLFERTFHMEERAAALASIAGRGQVWVRDDIPNVLVYTDDAGTDFVLNAASPGGGLPAGTIGDSSLKWDGISAWVEETQVAFPGGATGIKVFDATLGDFITMGHNGATAGFSVNGATTEVIFGQGGGPTIAWRFEEMVRVPDGSAALPGITFFGGGLTTGFFRTVAGLSASITGVEQVRIANAATQIASDDFRLIPNFGADLVRMIVNGPSNLNDFEIELTSLIDFHVSGSTGERFVLEEFNLAMVEKAAAPADVATVGQFWVRDDAPNTAMFTNDTGVDKALVNEVAQARRTTVFELTTAYVDITLDVTDVETDAAVLDHDLATNTDNIIIGQTGTYKIGYEVDVGAVTTGDSTITMEGRVRLNDGGTGIAGSNASTGCFEDGSIDGDFMDNHLSQTFYANLTAGDFVTLQLQKTELAGSEDYEVDQIILTAERCL